jgi:hypothetical protein
MDVYNISPDLIAFAAEASIDRHVQWKEHSMPPQPAPQPRPSQTSPGFRRLLIGLSVILIISGLVLLFTRTHRGTQIFSDFTQDYFAGYALRTGQSIYTPFTQEYANVQEMAMGETLYIPSDEVYNFHPPFVSILFVPLTFLPYDVAMMGWGVVALLLYGAIAALIMRELSIHLPLHWLLLLIGIALWWYPLLVHLLLGQLTLPLLACIIGCWLLLRRNHQVWAGALVGLACLIKLFPGLLFFYLLLRRQWWAIVSGIATFGIGMLITLLIVGPGDVLHYVEEVAPEDVKEFRVLITNHSFTGAISRMFIQGPWVRPIVEAPQVASIIIFILSGVVMVWLGLYGWRLFSRPLQQQATRQQDDTLFALFCIAMILLSPISWEHTFLFLMLPIGLLIADMQHWRAPLMKVLFILALALVSLPDVEIARTIVSLYSPGDLPWFAWVVLAAPTLGLLLFWGLMVARFHRLE